MFLFYVSSNIRNGSVYSPISTQRLVRVQVNLSSRTRVNQTKPCASDIPKVCSSSCPTKQCLRQIGDEIEIDNPEEQHTLSTHYISRSASGNLKISNFYNNRELRQHFCTNQESRCLNLHEKVVFLREHMIPTL